MEQKQSVPNWPPEGLDRNGFANGSSNQSPGECTSDPSDLSEVSLFTQGSVTSGSSYNVPPLPRPAVLGPFFEPVPFPPPPGISNAPLHCRIIEGLHSAYAQAQLALQSFEGAKVERGGRGVHSLEAESSDPSPPDLVVGTGPSACSAVPPPHASPATFEVPGSGPSTAWLQRHPILGRSVVVAGVGSGGPAATSMASLQPPTSPASTLDHRKSSILELDELDDLGASSTSIRQQLGLSSRHASLSTLDLDDLGASSTSIRQQLGLSRQASSPHASSRQSLSRQASSPLAAALSRQSPRLSGVGHPPNSEILESTKQLQLEAEGLRKAAEQAAAEAKRAADAVAVAKPLSDSTSPSSTTPEHQEVMRLLRKIAEDMQAPARHLQLSEAIQTSISADTVQADGSNACKSVQTLPTEAPTAPAPAASPATTTTPNAPEEIPGGYLRALSGSTVKLDLETGAIEGASLWLSLRPPACTRKFLHVLDIGSVTSDRLVQEPLGSARARKRRARRPRPQAALPAVPPPPASHAASDSSDDGNSKQEDRQPPGVPVTTHFTTPVAPTRLEQARQQTEVFASIDSGLQVLQEQTAQLGYVNPAFYHQEQPFQEKGFVPLSITPRQASGQRDREVEKSPKTPKRSPSLKKATAESSGNSPASAEFEALTSSDEGSPKHRKSQTLAASLQQSLNDTYVEEESVSVITAKAVLRQIQGLENEMSLVEQSLEGLRGIFVGTEALNGVEGTDTGSKFAGKTSPSPKQLSKPGTTAVKQKMSASSSTSKQPIGSIKRISAADKASGPAPQAPPGNLSKRLRHRITDALNLAENVALTHARFHSNRGGGKDSGNSSLSRGASIERSGSRKRSASTPGVHHSDALGRRSHTRQHSARGRVAIPR